VARKAGTAGSGRGPLEKDLHDRHLASGLPVPRRGDVSVMMSAGWNAARASPVAGQAGEAAELSVAGGP
ncbi:hypothetical protein, partial [Dactylosporangium sp. NPDC005555]|uniref:hypothetical protein n=1 Tax=Dactylosporangium sp. NPDC005555 TaxID=3154889 RepID=UPI0033BAD122